MVVTSTTCGCPFRFAHHLTQLKNNNDNNNTFFFFLDEAFATVHASIVGPAWLTAVRGCARPEG